MAVAYNESFGAKGTLLWYSTENAVNSSQVILFRHVVGFESISNKFWIVLCVCVGLSPRGMCLCRPWAWYVCCVYLGSISA